MKADLYRLALLLGVIGYVPVRAVATPGADGKRRAGSETSTGAFAQPSGEGRRQTGNQTGRKPAAGATPSQSLAAEIPRVLWNCRSRGTLAPRGRTGREKSAPLDESMKFRKPAAKNGAPARGHVPRGDDTELHDALQELDDAQSEQIVISRDAAGVFSATLLHAGRPLAEFPHAQHLERIEEVSPVAPSVKYGGMNLVTEDFFVLAISQPDTTLDEPGDSGAGSFGPYAVDEGDDRTGIGVLKVYTRPLGFRERVIHCLRTDGPRASARD